MTSSYWGHGGFYMTLRPGGKVSGDEIANILENLSATLGHWRRWRGISYGQMATEMGVTKSWLHKLEYTPGFVAGGANILKALRWVARQQEWVAEQRRFMADLDVTEGGDALAD